MTEHESFRCDVFNIEHLDLLIFANLDVTFFSCNRKGLTQSLLYFEMCQHHCEGADTSNEARNSDSIFKLIRVMVALGQLKRR